MRRELLRLLLGSVAGGLPPRRPDQVTPVSTAGVAPGSSSGITRARLVIISGPGSGMFLYSGTPGLGDLVESVSEATRDPFGNPVNPGFASYDNVFGGVAVVHGAVLSLFAGTTRRAVFSPSGLSVFNSSGALIYNIDLARAAQFLYADTGGASQGALIASEAQAGGTDQFGNAYLPGVTDYTQVINHGFFAVSLIAGGVSFFTASAAAGPWTQAGGVSIGSGAVVGIPSGALVLGSSNEAVRALPSDNNVYRTERLVQKNAANVPLTTVAAAVFAGLPVAAEDYLVKADLLVTIGGTAAALTVGVTGPAVASVTNVKFRFFQDSTGGQQIFSGHIVAGLGTVTEPGTTWPAGAVVQVEIVAHVSFTAASGTNLNVTAAVSVASAGSQVSLGSTMEVMPE